jgi:hypothetical protein
LAATRKRKIILSSMKNQDTKLYIFKSGINERQSMEFIYRVPKVFLFFIIITPIFLMLNIFIKEGHINNFHFISSTIQIGKVLLIPLFIVLLLFLFNASFTLYSFKFNRNIIYKSHFIYKWKSRKINIEEIEFVEVIPVMWRAGYFHLIFYGQQKNLKVEGLKWKIGKNAIKKINELNLKVYIRQENNQRYSYYKFLEELRNEGIKFNDKNYSVFIAKHPKYKKVYY